MLNFSLPLVLTNDIVDELLKNYIDLFKIKDNLYL